MQKSAKSNSLPIDTREEIAKMANVSHDTINKVENIESNAIEEVKESIRSGNISINQAAEVSKLDNNKK